MAKHDCFIFFFKIKHNKTMCAIYFNDKNFSISSNYMNSITSRHINKMSEIFYKSCTCYIVQLCSLAYINVPISSVQPPCNTIIEWIFCFFSKFRITLTIGEQHDWIMAVLRLLQIENAITQIDIPVRWPFCFHTWKMLYESMKCIYMYIYARPYDKQSFTKYLKSRNCSPSLTTDVEIFLPMTLAQIWDVLNTPIFT